MIALRPRDQHVWDPIDLYLMRPRPRPRPITVRPRPRPRPKKVVSRPRWSRDLNISVKNSLYTVSLHFHIKVFVMIVRSRLTSDIQVSFNVDRWQQDTTEKPVLRSSKDLLLVKDGNLHGITFTKLSVGVKWQRRKTQPEKTNKTIYCYYYC